MLLNVPPPDFTTRDALRSSGKVRLASKVQAVPHSEKNAECQRNKREGASSDFVQSVVLGWCVISEELDGLSLQLLES